MPVSLDEPTAEPSCMKILRTSQKLPEMRFKRTHAAELLNFVMPVLWTSKSTCTLLHVWSPLNPIFTCSAAYGSYVVWGTKLRCRISETVVFSPKKEIMILIILTWVFEVFTV